MANIGALWRIAQPPPALLFGVSLLLLIETAATLAIPWVGGRFAEQVLVTSEASGYRSLLLIWLVLLMAQNALRFVSGYLLGSTGAAATSRLRCRIYDHLQALPLSYHQESDPGNTLSLFSRDTGILGQFFTTTLPNLAPQLLTLLGAWLLMARLDLPLALMIGVTVPAITLGLKLFLRRIRPIANQLAEAHGTHMAIVEENLRLLNLLKAFGREEQESQKVKEQNTGILSLEQRHLLATGLISPVVQTIGGALLIVMLWFSAERLLHGELSAGQVVSLLLYGLLLFRPASQLASAAGSFQSTLGASNRLQQLLSSPIEPFDEGREAAPAHPGNLRFENITFAYPGQARLLANFNLSITAGEILAITGKNGTGKSTLLHLLMRFMEPSEGRIFMDGTNIRELKLNTLRSLIGLVPQHATLINGTIRDNIAFGVPNATQADIEQAAEHAQLRTLITSLPKGLDTIVGTNGVLLSGGQRQRIALARALLRACPILLLDEATSMFDPHGEKAFLESCQELFEDRTVIIITHREASLAIATRRLELSA